MDILKLAAVFLLFVSAVSISRLSRLTNSKAISSQQNVDIYLNEKVSLDQLGNMLADSGVVASEEEVVWAGKLLGWRTFQKGYYQIDGNYSYEVLLSRIARGIQDPVSITIVPGSTEERIIGNIAAKMHFEPSELEEAFNDSLLLDSLGVDRRDLIGRMLSDTYSMFWTYEPEMVLNRIMNEFQNKILGKYGNRLEELNRSMDEIVTLASIIEWEANIPEEKVVISGVYWNRLERGMRLQADPTVNYAIDERRRLLYEDYQIDHPYNTYINSGLPPGPITNPGLKSIEAALYPEDHDYLYMVASPQGYHVFSRTYEEHKRQTAKWRKWIREQYRKKRLKESE